MKILVFFMAAVTATSIRSHGAHESQNLASPEEILASHGSGLL